MAAIERRKGRSARPAALRYRGDEPALGRDRDRDRSRQTRRAPARSSRMAFVQSSCRAGDNHAHAAPAEMPGIEPGRKRLAVHPPELVVEPRLPLLRQPPRPLLRGLEPSHQPTVENHVHRSARLGTQVLVKENWYKGASRALAFRTSIAFQRERTRSLRKGAPSICSERI